MGARYSNLTILAFGYAFAGCAQQAPSGTVLVEHARPNQIVSVGSSLYWTTDDSVNSLSLVDDGARPKLLAAGYTRATALAVDATSVYFADEGTYNSYSGGIFKMNRDGSGLETLADNLLNPCAIVVDDGNVFWSSRNGVSQVSVNADNLTVDVPSVDSTNIAIEGSQLYFVDHGSAAISRVAVGGGTATRLIEDAAIGIAVTATAMFWSTRSTENSPGMLKKADLSGGQAVTIAASDQLAGIPALVLDDDALYWYVDQIERTSLDGTTEDLSTSQDTIQGLATDAEHVYWGAWGESAIKMIAK